METERVLLRALVLPESDAARALAAHGLAENSAWIADLATADLLEKARAQGYEFEILAKPVHPQDLLSRLRS